MGLGFTGLGVEASGDGLQGPGFGVKGLRV